MVTIIGRSPLAMALILMKLRDEVRMVMEPGLCCWSLTTDTEHWTAMNVKSIADLDRYLDGERERQERKDMMSGYADDDYLLEEPDQPIPQGRHEWLDEPWNSWLKEFSPEECVADSSEPEFEFDKGILYIV
jgi:hypothetical protein